MSDERKVVDITELGNPAKPQGTYGKQMLHDMNEHHASVTEWGLSFLDISDDAEVLDIKTPTLIQFNYSTVAYLQAG